MAAWERIRRCSDLNGALAPHGLTAHPGPTRGAQVGQELSQFTFVFGLADETAERVLLAGTRRTPFSMHPASEALTNLTEAARAAKSRKSIGKAPAP